MIAPARRGSAYIAVLGTAMVVSIIGMGALSIVRSQRLLVIAETDTAKARLYAESAVELGAEIIDQDSNWRSNRTNGPWISSATIGDGTFSIDGTDPLDGNLSNRPTDPLVIRGTGIRGNARQMVQATLTSSGGPMDFLAMAVHTAGILRVRAGDTLTVTGAPASTNTSLRNENVIAGSVECVTAVSTGTITGSLTMPAPTKAMPPAGVVSMYAALGVAISPGNTMQKVALSPQLNPYGTPSPDGVYVWSPGADVTIKLVRIEGTLVINNPGKKVTIDQTVLMHNARPDYPVLIVDGNLTLQYDSSGTLSESTQATNFNPAGVPYPYPGGATNATQIDTYPSEIQGLVHCRGSVTVAGSSGRIRGALICEYSGAGEAVDVSSPFEIVYDPTLYSNPPMGYQQNLKMVIQTGSWRQVVLP